MHGYYSFFIKRKLFAALLLLLSRNGVAYGQKGENVYAAPGMPVMLARRPLAGVAAKATPVLVPWLSDPLPRFWKSMDLLVYRQNVSKLWQALSQRVRYPEAALKSQVEGVVQIRILINPDGAPLSVSVFKTAFMPALADRKASEALEAETLRAAQQLRFQPKVGPVDTVTFPVTYRIQ